ncbi:MAG: DUF2141 domain-containing protein [Myxococcales bacterium]|nr:DUF2141 domain-containing protein [Myxococcales bacterium]
MYALLALLGAVATTNPVVAEADAPATATVVVNMVHFRSSNGQALVSLYNGGSGFPGKPERAYQSVVTKITGRVSQHVFSGLPPGDYALSVAHDENGNNKLDTNFLGIPKEGVGVSNNTRRMGPPRYREAKFTVAAGAQVTQTIELFYIFKS